MSETALSRENPHEYRGFERFYSLSLFLYTVREFSYTVLDF